MKKWDHFERMTCINSAKDVELLDLRCTGAYYASCFCQEMLSLSLIVVLCRDHTESFVFGSE